MTNPDHQDHATWVSFTNEEMTALIDILNNGVSYLDPNRQIILDRLNGYLAPDSKDQVFRDAAAGLNIVSDGVCEIDDHAVTSTSDEGSYVMAWVWVSNEEAGIEAELEVTCRTEGCKGDPDDGEGWDGYCGNCADAKEES